MILPSVYLEAFVSAMNIVLIFVAAFMSFMILRLIVLEKTHVHFDIEKLKIAWNLLTLTIFFFALGHVFSYVVKIDGIIFEDNVKMIFLAILVAGLYYFYKSISPYTTTKAKTVKQKRKN